MSQTDSNFAHEPVSQPLPSPTPGQQKVDQLKPAPRPFIFFEWYAELLRSMLEDLDDVERCMKLLREKYLEVDKSVSLLLRPWSRKKGYPPYAIYWVRLCRKQRRFDPDTGKEVDDDSRPRWFKRLKIRRVWDLDLAIHRAGLDHDRPRIHRFHAEAQVLNETHRALARAFDSARKSLGGRVAGAGLEAPPIPYDEGWLPSGILSLAIPAWRLECLLQRTNSDLALLAKIQERQARWLGLRMELRPISEEHPVGKLVWRHLETRATYSRLNDRTKRKLGLSVEKRKAITSFEVEHRRLVAGQKAGLSIARKLNATAHAAMETARINLGWLKIARPDWRYDCDPV